MIYQHRLGNNRLKKGMAFRFTPQAWNVSARAAIESRTYVIGFPLWAGLVNASQAAKIAQTLSEDDMLAADGLRSTSSVREDTAVFVEFSFC